MRNAIALGTFDGLHAGHRSVLQKALKYHSVAVTFRTSPKAVMTGVSEMLMTPEDKCRALTELGIDEICLLDFLKVRQMNAESFLDALVRRYNPVLISCGYNYRFGNGARGDSEFLQKYCAANGIGFSCSGCVSENGQPVSSTAIRQLLKNGEVQQANRQMWGGFGFTGEVLHGDRRGRTIGFPTVNQLYPDMLVPLRFGVYTAQMLFDGKSYNGIANIGIRPTFRTKHIMCETYLDGFSGDLYGHQVTLKPQKFLREERKFNSLSELKETITADLHNAFSSNNE